MNAPRIRFFFDYLDPLSYLLDLEISDLEEAEGRPLVERVPLEINPPPGDLLDPDGNEWTARWRAALDAASDMEVRLTAPTILPWTRKAHELVLQAVGKGVGLEAHRAIFQAVFGEGADVGRVDVLVGIAEKLGMDPQDTKAVLDVDRHTAAVGSLRHEAETAGVTEPPALEAGGRILRGFHNREALRTFLRSP